MFTTKQVLGLGLGGLGVLFFITWLILFLAWKKQMSYDTVVYAEVVSIERRSSNQTSGYMYYPHYSLNYQGRLYELVSHVGISNNNRTVGEMVKLYIDRENPKHFRVAGSNVLKGLWIIFLSLGSVFFLLGVILFIIGML